MEIAGSLWWCWGLRVLECDEADHEEKEETEEKADSHGEGKDGAPKMAVG